MDRLVTVARARTVAVARVVTALKCRLGTFAVPIHEFDCCTAAFDTFLSSTVIRVHALRLFDFCRLWESLGIIQRTEPTVPEDDSRWSRTTRKA